MITSVRKKIRLAMFVTAGLLLLGQACKKKDPDPSPSNNGNNPPPTPTVIKWDDTIAREWKVYKATHNGTTDGSSTGLELDIKKGGTYILSTGHNGKWWFRNNYKNVMLDSGTSFQTKWTMDTFTSKKMVVSFKSPFTGGDAIWWMQPL